MRFLFGMEPIAHLESKLANSFNSIGIEAHKYSYQEKHNFYDLKDYQPLKHDYLKTIKKLTQHTDFETIDDFLSSGLQADFEKEIEFYLKNYDAFCFINGKSLLPCNFDFPILKKHNKIIISIFSGSEIRYPNYAQEMWKLNGFDFPSEIQETPYPDHYLKHPIKYLSIYSEYMNVLEKKRQHTLMAEVYSDLILSVPEMSGIQTSPYLPYIHSIDTQNIVFKNNKRKTKPIVAHLPSNPTFKKSKFILEKVDELKQEGLDFDFIYLTNIPHKDVLEILEGSDILIDQMSLFPATIAHEAMASGCVCLTGNDIAGIPVPLKINHCPAVNINQNNFKEVLKEHITHFQLRDQLIEQGKYYIDHFCTIDMLAPRIISYIERFLNKDFDYFPSYAFSHMVTIPIESPFIRDLQFKSTMKNGIFDKAQLSNFLQLDHHTAQHLEIPEWKDQTIQLAPYIHVNQKYKDFFKG
jgi:hypothetical protein